LAPLGENLIPWISFGLAAREETRLDRRAKVELFEQIRREYEYGAGTIKGVAGKFGAHRRMVREALGDAVPRERKINTRGKPRIEPVKAFIDTILQGDENEPPEAGALLPDRIIAFPSAYNASIPRFIVR
jgi:hypothetical protein